MEIGYYDDEDKKNEEKEMDVTSLVCVLSIVYLVSLVFLTLIIFKYSITNKRRRPKFQSLILLRAAVDLTYLFVISIVFFYTRTNLSSSLGLYSCKLLPSIGPILKNISISIMVIILIQHCRKVVFPEKPQYSNEMFHIVLFCSAVFIIVSYYPYVHSWYIVDGVCVSNTAHDSRLAILGYTIVFCLDIVLALVILITRFSIFTKNLIGKEKEMEEQEKEPQEKYNDEITRVIFWMALSDLICVLPYDIHQLIQTSSNENQKLDTPYTETYASVLNVIQISHCMFNSAIFCILTTNMRMFIKELFCKRSIEETKVRRAISMDSLRTEHQASMSRPLQSNEGYSGADMTEIRQESVRC